MSAKKAAKQTAPAKKADAHAASGKKKSESATGKSTDSSLIQKNEAGKQNSEASSADTADKQGGITGEAVGSVLNARNNRSPKPYGRHFRTVELAARLACAQITAEEYSRSAWQTVSGVQKIVAAFLTRLAGIKVNAETLCLYPELRDLAYVDKAIFDLLTATEHDQRSPYKNTPLNHPDYDDLFEGAMFRAQRLLRTTTEDTTTIHAEQLFDAEEMLSESRVGTRFEICKWPGLLHRDDFHPFIVRVERWFYDHLERLNFPEEDERYAEDAEMMGCVLNLGRRRHENDLLRRICDLIEAHELLDRQRGAWTSSEKFAHAIWTESVIKVICCERRPSRSREDEKRTIRYYRPWGLFRFLRIFGADDPVGRELLESLTCERRDLAQDSVVHPFRQNYPRTYDFGPLDHLVRKQQREEMRESSVRIAVAEADSVLLDAVQTVKSLPEPITAKFQKDVLGCARSGQYFDPKWAGRIKDGFKAILLAGTECPMDCMIRLLTKFYFPLLDAYGVLDAVLTHRCNHDPHELLDLFPDGWYASLSKCDPEPASQQHAPENQQENGGAQAADAMKLTLRSGAGQDRSVFFHRSASVKQTTSDDA